MFPDSSDCDLTGVAQFVRLDHRTDDRKTGLNPVTFGESERRSILEPQNCPGRVFTERRRVCASHQRRLLGKDRSNVAPGQRRRKKLSPRELDAIKSKVGSGPAYRTLAKIKAMEQAGTVKVKYPVNRGTPGK